MLGVNKKEIIKTLQLESQKVLYVLYICRAVVCVRLLTFMYSS